MAALVCPLCGADMRIIAFIVDTAIVRDILAHLGEPTAPPRIAPARGPPLWEAAGAEDDPSPDRYYVGPSQVGPLELQREFDPLV